jgi:hypothetical protein
MKKNQFKEHESHTHTFNQFSSSCLFFIREETEVIYDEYLDIDNNEVLHPLSGPCIVNPQSQFII